MTRWFLILLLAVGSVCPFGTLTLMSPARAEGEDAAPPAVTLPAETTVTPPADTTTAPPAETAVTPAETTAPAPPAMKIPSKADIRAALADGKSIEAEQAYLSWASYWGEDDPALVIAVEHEVLLQQYRSGKFTALADMVTAGDRDAINTLRSLVLAGKGNLPSTDLTVAIRLLGTRKDKSLLNTLRLALYSDDKAVVIAAIDALGTMGDKRIVPELLALFEKSDLETNVALARAVTKLGAAKQVQKRYLAQLRFPLPGAREKAALILGATGNPAGWATISQIITAKDAAYYPLALTVLATMPSPESQAWVAQGLVGTEQEQVAALQSMAVFTSQKQEELLFRLLHDNKMAVNVRVASIDMLAKMKSVQAMRELRKLAMKWEPTEAGFSESAQNAKLDPEQLKAEYAKMAADAPITAKAMFSLQQLGQLKDQEYRKYIHIRIDDEKWNADVVRSARVALLGYALECTPSMMAMK